MGALKHSNALSRLHHCIQADLRTLRLFLTFIVGLLFSNPGAWAATKPGASVASEALASVLQVNRMTNGGSGCPQGSLVGRAETMGGEVKLKLKDFSARVGGTEIIDRKNCAFSFPYELSAGKRLVVEEIAFETQTALPNETQGVLSLEVFRSGSLGRQIERELAKSGTEARPQKLKVIERSVFTSACGEQGILRFNSAVRLNGRTGQGQARVGIDAIGVKFRVEGCGG